MEGGTLLAATGDNRGNFVHWDLAGERLDFVVHISFFFSLGFYLLFFLLGLYFVNSRRMSATLAGNERISKRKTPLA